MDSVRKSSPPRQVAIIGAGVIGAAWAARWLLRGCDVLLYDPSDEAMQIVPEVLENARYAWERMGTSPKSEGSVTYTKTIDEATGNADFIQESTPEDLQIKKSILREIEISADKSAVIASSTSGLLPSNLQDEMRHPDRLVIGHPFNPVYLIPMVEVVGGEKTSAESISTAMSFYTHAGMKPLHVRVEIDAFIADRLLESVWREALWLVEDGVATTQEIDDVIRFGFGLRWAQMGLFENYRIAGGRGGMEHFIRQFGPSLDWPWSRLTDTPEMTEELVNRIAEQSDAQSGEYSVRELERIRDTNLVDMMLALENNAWGAGLAIRDLRANPN
tara:strand:+ start:658 stop:1650 length:993 start_codon:yes stop_codon:yes gene_type:complete